MEKLFFDMNSASIPSSAEIANSRIFAEGELALFKKKEKLWTRGYLSLQLTAFAAFMSVIFGFIPLNFLMPVSIVTFALPFVFLFGCMAVFPVIDNGMTLTVYVRGLSEVSKKEREEFVALGTKFKEIGVYLSRIENAGRYPISAEFKIAMAFAKYEISELQKLIKEDDGAFNPNFGMI